ncbi:MAG: helix-turn-helix domain-containing protein [Mollicutes bacterium]|nr:helix-turn-helix domain-containing protein [Mollicutes bacterium]MDD7263704.1 helix-turn-helix transcriptional regulator [bacterium]MDY4979449.1 helix-turn-helix transcriptional regulator [Candidatus Onthovivens sp.]
MGQVELAKAIGASKGVISLWENGLREPTMCSLIILAKFFNISIDELVGLY